MDVSRDLLKFASHAGFIHKDGIFKKGALCVGLVVTRHARSSGFPLNPDELMTDQQGQVSGLGKAQVQAILADYEISRVLAEEGGRTNRGSISQMRDYVDFLNTAAKSGRLDLNAVETWWIEQVRRLFADRPFPFRLDPARSLSASVTDLLGQAEARQRERSGFMYVGAVMQHLVGAKLDIIVEGVDHHGAFVADQVSGRPADFQVNEVAIHVTASPGEAVVRKCCENLQAGLRPVILTRLSKVAMALGLVEAAGAQDRVEVWAIEQFLSTNLHEQGKFNAASSREVATRIVAKYNCIIDVRETDPGLKIELR